MKTENNMYLHLYSFVVVLTLVMATPAVSVTGNTFVDDAVLPIGFYLVGLGGIFAAVIRNRLIEKKSSSTTDELF